MRVVILGAGGVGGYLGARLISGGADVTFLTRDARAAALKAAGLVVKSPLGDFAAPVKVIPAGTALATPPDAVVLACKEPALAEALDAVAPLLGPQTRLLPLLNGVRHLDTLAARFPDTTLLGGIIHGATDLRPDGVIAHLSSFMTVITGPVATPSDPVADEFVAQIESRRRRRLCDARDPPGHVEQVRVPRRIRRHHLPDARQHRHHPARRMRAARASCICWRKRAPSPLPRAMRRRKA